MNENFAVLCTSVARLFRKHFADEAKEFNGTGAQWRALAIVGGRPGLSQGELAEILEVEPITTCRMIDRMEQAGLIERRRDPADRRAWHLFVTEAAEPVQSQMQQVGERLVARGLSGLSGAEVTTLCQLLERVRENLTDVEIRNGDTRNG
jgi:DNA-binding MarR family transcriptional regulator